MKTRTIFALLLAATLVVPALAQNNSTPRPAATIQSSRLNPNSDGHKGRQRHRQDPLQPETREGFWAASTRSRARICRSANQPIRDRINELDELTAANSKAIKDTDLRAQQGIQLASARQRSRSARHRGRQQGAGGAADAQQAHTV